MTSLMAIDPAETSGSVRIAPWLALAAVLAAGAALRLVWLDDMEYKADEAWTWRHALAAGQGGPVPWVGMPSSAGPENPGMSVWVFIPLCWRATGPVDLARGVAWLGIAALVVWVAFACRCVPRREREIWLWAAALSAVNPLSVLHERKIWPPSVFHLLVLVFVFCWWRRQRPLSAFCWGLLGPIMAQIHPSAAFFATGFALSTWLADRSRTAWKAWLAGSILASLPLIPWLLHISTVSNQPHLTTLKWTRVLEGKFLLRWISEPFGIGLDHALGNDYVDFLRQPLLAGKPTFLVAMLHLAAVGIALAIGWRWFARWCQARPAWRQALFPVSSPTALVCTAAFWGYGTLLTFTCLPLHRQYMIIVYSLEALWVAYAALNVNHIHGDTKRSGRRLLAGLVMVQLLLSVSFLKYIHVKQVIDGDYGVAFRAQSHRERVEQAGNTKREAPAR